jgi:hypothetical protein
MTALRALLEGIVDYAGLFPPAALDMQSAVRNYASYRSDAASWMLGRFVVPVARLDEFIASRASVDGGADPWVLSALLGRDPRSDVESVREFNSSQRERAVIDSLEGKLDDPAEIERVAEAVGHELELFAELPLDRDPTPLVAAVKRSGIKAKMRTGGVVASAVPSAGSVVRFMRACLDAGVAFKATAGLHHPLRAVYRLTYDTGGPTGLMFGYLNVFLAAAFLAQGMTGAAAVRLLDERDSSSFVFDDDSISWNGFTLSESQLRQAREQVAVAFGSCSFREPVDELRLVAPV